jgi:C4-dicarboxylate-specific signal transduction histidine kinase
LILAQKILKRVARNADRIAGIVQRTRDAIIASPDVSQSVSLKSLIIETTDLIGLELRAAGIQLKIEVGEDELSVLADPIGLQQVVFNLLANAADALREWGGPRVITISLEGKITMGGLASRTPGQASILNIWHSFFSRFSQRRKAASAWDCRYAAPLSKPSAVK